MNASLWVVACALFLPLVCVTGEETPLSKDELKQRIQMVASELKLKTLKDLDPRLNILSSETFVRLWDQESWQAEDLVKVTLSSQQEGEIVVAVLLAHSMSRRDLIVWFKEVIGDRESLVWKDANLLAFAVCPGRIFDSICRFAHTPGVRELLLRIIKEKGDQLNKDIVKLIEDALYQT